jgi:hypothetical protein
MMVTVAWNPLGFHLLDSLPRVRTFNAEYYPDNILSALLPLRPQADGRKFMIHADKANPTRLANAELVVPKMPHDLPHTDRIRLISHCLTSFFSGMLSTVRKERFFDHAKNYLKLLVRQSPRSHQRLCTASLSTGWRGSNGFLRKTVTTIHQLNSNELNFS